MAKYDPLREALQSEQAGEVILTFAEIERLVGRLPASALNYDEWWSNEDHRTTRHVQSKAWGAAGFAASVDRKGCTVVFHKA
jgi:hypothetical protein